MTRQERIERACEGKKPGEWARIEWPNGKVTWEQVPSAPIITETKYYGIQVAEDRGYWYIQDDCGRESLALDHKPTPQDIDNYANAIRYAA